MELVLMKKCNDFIKKQHTRMGQMRDDDGGMVEKLG
jgi:hypothetical protein